MVSYVICECEYNPDLEVDAQSGHYQGDATICELTGSSVKVVSWSPRVLVYKNFITKAEAEYLMILGKDKLGKLKI